MDAQELLKYQKKIERIRQAIPTNYPEEPLRTNLQEIYKGLIHAEVYIDRAIDCFKTVVAPPTGFDTVEEALNNIDDEF